MAKYIYDSNYVHDKDAELIVATYAIANELAELNEFLKSFDMDKDKFNKLIRAWLGG